MLIPDRFSTGGAAPRRRLPLAALAIAWICAAAMPVQAATVVEMGDAGESLATAQISSGNGNSSLKNIFGVIGNTTDADLYLINITNPTLFSASTVNASTDDIDTQLFLFTFAGAPVYANDDDASGLSLKSTLAAGNSFGPVAAGKYYLGIALSGYDPVNSNNQLLFATGLSTDTRGPAFGLQPATLGGFTGAGFDSQGAYDIQLTGAAVAVAVPEPASALLWLLGAGALGLGRFARRQRQVGAVRAGATLPVST